MTDITPPHNDIVEKIEELNGYSNARANEYRIVVDQLDMLYKDKFDNLVGILDTLGLGLDQDILESALSHISLLRAK